jgi:hypothetical protein
MRIVTGRLLFEHGISSPAIPVMWLECASSRGFFTTFCAEASGRLGRRTFKTQSIDQGELNCVKGYSFSVLDDSAS